VVKPNSQPTPPVDTPRSSSPSPECPLSSDSLTRELPIVKYDINADLSLSLDFDYISNLSLYIHASPTSLMMNGRNNGKKIMAVRIVQHAFEIIHLVTEQNPVQVLGKSTGTIMLKDALTISRRYRQHWAP
jgi:hypothetical protein